jgi:hypothetical protein
MFYYLYEFASEKTIQRIWDIINNAKPEDWWREKMGVEWRLSLPHNIFENDYKTNILIQKFVEPHRLYVQRLEAHTSYDWHTDYARDTSITLCLNELIRSMTIFSEHKSIKSPTHWPNIMPLRYQKNGLYLIDGSKPHTGINFSDNIRYLVSVSLSRRMNLGKAVRYLNTISEDQSSKVGILSH